MSAEEYSIQLLSPSLHASAFCCQVDSSLAALLSRLDSLTKYPCSPALLLSRSLSELFQVFHLFLWLCGSLWFQVEILSRLNFYDPCVAELLLSAWCCPLSSLPTPEKPEIYFLITFSPSITYFSHHVESFKDDRLWYGPPNEPRLSVNSFLLTALPSSLSADGCFSSALFL